MRIIVIGCGRVGSGLAYRMQSDVNEVTVVDRDPAAFERLGPGFHGRSLVGTALERDLLVRAGIEDADSLASVTGSDEINAVVSRLAARRFRVPRVVARMYDPRQAELYARLGVLTISPVEWGVSRLGHLIGLRDVSQIAALGGGQLQIVEAAVPPLLAGREAKELEIPGETRVVALTRSGKTFLVDRRTTLQGGDLVAVAVARGAEAALENLLSLG